MRSHLKSYTHLCTRMTMSSSTKEPTAEEKVELTKCIIFDFSWHGFYTFFFSKPINSQTSDFIFILEASINRYLRRSMQLWDWLWKLCSFNPRTNNQSHLSFGLMKVYVESKALFICSAMVTFEYKLNHLMLLRWHQPYSLITDLYTFW